MLRNISSFPAGLFRAFVILVLASCLVVLGLFIGISDFKSPVSFMKQSGSFGQSSLVRIVSPGENIQVDDLQVHIATAVHYHKNPTTFGFELFLNGWARHKTRMKFKCCLLQELPTGSFEISQLNFTEVNASLHHIYTQWIVDMQNAEFSCAIRTDNTPASADANFSYVMFAKESCYNASPIAMEIVHPEQVPNSVGLCLKISYGTLNPEKMVEWFEYTRMMEVTKVFTYYFHVDPPVFEVLDYYQSIGYLDMIPIHPARSKGGCDRGFRHPRWDEQVWVDEVMAINDCKHRMASFDYVIVIDIDEFILPKLGLSSYFDILKATEKKQSMAVCFEFDSHVVMPDWGATRSSPLHITRYTNRTTVPNYNGRDMNTRWAFRPNLTRWVKNNGCSPDKPYESLEVPRGFYILFHYRSCKLSWSGCQERERIEDESMLNYETELIDRILSLPLEKILYNNTKYVDNMIEWKINSSLATENR